MNRTGVYKCPLSVGVEHVHTRELFLVTIEVKYSRRKKAQVKDSKIIIKKVCEKFTIDIGS